MSETDLPETWSLTGTEIANLLFWIRKITGNRPRAAQFTASWNSPSLVDPSPDETYTTSSVPFRTAPIAVPTAWRYCVPVGLDCDTIRHFR